MTELPQPLVTPFAPNLYVSFGDQVLNFEEASRDQWLPGPSDDDKRAQWMALLLDPDVRKVADHPEAPSMTLVDIDSSFIAFETYIISLHPGARPGSSASAAGGAHAAVSQSSASAAGGARPGSSEVIVIEDSDEELL